MYLTDIQIDADGLKLSLSIEHDWRPGRRATFDSEGEPAVVERWKIDSIDKAVIYPFGGDYGLEVQLVDDNYEAVKAKAEAYLRENFDDEVIEAIVENFDREAQFAA